MHRIIISCICLMFAYSGFSQETVKVKAKDALEIIKNRDRATSVIIDGRSEEMFLKKHIAGAIYIDAFQKDVSEKLTPFLEKREIIVYCTSNKRAGILVQKLEELKYGGKIIFITDGIKGWIAAGYKTIDIDKTE